MTYANIEEVSTFTGITENDLPSDIRLILKRASELIDMATYNRASAYSDKEKISDAVCAQVEYWLSVGVDVDIEGAPSEISIGDMHLNMRGSNAGALLSNRAKRILFIEGLLYCGVKLK